MINRLLEFRLMRGFTQEEVASFIGISRTAYYNLEHGISVPNLRTAMLLARSLYVPVTSLFDFSDEMKIYNEVIRIPENDDISLDDILRSVI